MRCCFAAYGARSSSARKARRRDAHEFQLRLRLTHVLAMALAALPFQGCHDGSDEGLQATHAGEGASREVPERSGPSNARGHGSAYTIAGFPSVATEHVSQWVTISNDNRSLKVRTLDDLSLPSEENAVLEVFSASFDITCAAARGQDDLFVGGVARDGDVVVENWLIQPHVGARVVTVQADPLPVGQATTPAYAAAIVIGGQYVPVPERTIATPRIVRNEILRTDTISELISLVVDPEGRFLLLLDASRSLYQIDLLPDPQVPQVLYTPQEWWALPHVIGASRYHTEHSGRLYIFHLAGGLTDPDSGVYGPMVGVLSDQENDGLFEAPYVLPTGIAINQFLSPGEVIADYIGIWPSL